MSEFIELDSAYSTTRRLRKVAPEEVEAELKAAQKPEHQFETSLFLPEREGRKGEGGLRTKGLFKKGSDEKPLITVITVVFNGEAHLEETILSVITQTYDNVEYIIIDGASTDGTLEIIRKYEHAIDYWVSEQDNGIYDAMNKSCRLSHGNALSFLNSGDRFIGDVLSAIKSIPCLLPCKVREADGRVWRKLATSPKQGLPTTHQAIIFPNHKILYNTTYKISADYDFFLRHRGDFIQTKTDEAYVLYDNSGFSTQNKLTRNIETVAIISRHFGVLDAVKFLMLRANKKLKLLKKWHTST